MNGLKTNNYLDVFTKKSLFTDKEYFDIWSKTISGEDWRDIIGNLDINSPVEAEIKKILFTDKTHFEVWLKAMRIDYLLNIIDNIKTYNETDCIIAYKFFDNNEVFEILSQKINEDDWNDIISHFDRNDRVLGKTRIYNQKIKKMLELKTNDDKHILSDERKKELLTDDSQLETFLNNRYYDDLLNIILVLDSSNELNYALKKKILT